MLPCRACLVSVLLPLLLLRGPLPVSCLHVDADAPSTATAHRQDGAAWRSFQQLLDARRGSRVAGLADLKRYLARFEYMPGAEQHEPATDAFDAHMEAAVRRYQSALSLPVTGQLDSATLDRIMAPRCGVGDTGHGAASVSLTATGVGTQPAGGAVSRFTFFKGEPRWTQPDPLVLTYAISTTATVDYLPAEAVRAVFRRAFARWARVVPVGFVETDDYYAADIRVGFYVGSHGDGIPFDGPLGVLSHAFSPRNGRLHLDAAERWAVDMDAEKAHTAVDLSLWPRTRSDTSSGWGTHRCPRPSCTRASGRGRRRRSSPSMTSKASSGCTGPTQGSVSTRSISRTPPWRRGGAVGSLARVV